MSIHFQSYKPSNMADDREILREIWEGRIPVQFMLSPDEVFTVEPAEPFYVSEFLNIL